MIVAGVDIGNTTTEVLLAEVTADGVIPLVARRTRTKGEKGAEDSVKGAAQLILGAEQTLGKRVELLLLPPLHPVLTTSASLPPAPVRPGPLRRLDRPSAATPAGRGFAAGAHLPLGALAGRHDTEGPIVVSVPEGLDFEEAAARIAEAQREGLPIVGAIVAGDDAVLIGNRIARAIPIVDEAEVDGLPVGALVALEVAEPGGRVQTLGDPVALVAAFGLAPEAAASLAAVAARLADARCAALVLGDEEADGAALVGGGWVEFDGEHGLHRVPLAAGLAEQAGAIRPGAVRRVLAPPGTPLHEALGATGSRVRDVFAVDLPAVRRAFLPRHGSIELDDVPLAFMLAPTESSAAPEVLLADAAGRPVRVLPSEAEAAALGALSTPGASPNAAVCDLGGGTVDLVWGTQRITAAGAGELLTVAVARALGLRDRAAEYVKRSASFRVETPRMVRYEDGTRAFVDQELPPDTIGRLCHPRGTTPVPFSDHLAPEEWRSLRLAIKRQVIGANVARCLRLLDGGPATLILSGGAALDAEAVRIVGEAAGPLGTTVGRADVGGKYGPRYGVALGLLLAFQRSRLPDLYPPPH